MKTSPRNKQTKNPRSCFRLDLLENINSTFHLELHVFVPTLLKVIDGVGIFCSQEEMFSVNEDFTVTVHSKRNIPEQSLNDGEDEQVQFSAFNN